MKSFTAILWHSQHHKFDGSRMFTSIFVHQPLSPAHSMIQWTILCEIWIFNCVNDNGRSITRHMLNISKKKARENGVKSLDYYNTSRCVCWPLNRVFIKVIKRHSLFARGVEQGWGINKLLKFDQQGWRFLHEPDVLRGNLNLNWI